MWWNQNLGPMNAWWLKSLDLSVNYSYKTSVYYYACTCTCTFDYELFIPLGYTGAMCMDMKCLL